MAPKITGSSALFRSEQSGVFKCPVIAGFSINIEFVVNGIIPEAVKLGQSKVTVARIATPLADEGNYTVWPFGEGPVKIWGERKLTTYAGSSANIQSAIYQLQRNLSTRQEVGIIATIGSGNQAVSLIDALDNKGVKYALVLAAGTNVTVNLRDTKHQSQVMLCEKNDWIVPTGLVEHLMKFDPRVVVFTGVRTPELALVRDIFTSYKQSRKGAIRVFSPHLDVLNREDLQRPVREVITGCHILSISRDEALRLVADQRLFEGSKFDPQYDSHVEKLTRAVARLGAPITIVTYDKDGVAAVAGGDYLRHFGFEPTKEVCDTAGAGDAFLAALIYYYALEDRRLVTQKRRVNVERLRYAIDHAQVVSTQKVTHVGSRSGIPTEQEVKKFLQKKPPRRP